jgi:predicted phosphodiesterase
MKIQILSDLHVDFDRLFKLKQTDADVLVIAGDVSGSAHRTIQYIESIDKEYSYKHIVFVAGNHEFYGYDISDAIQQIENAFSNSDSVHFLNNSCVEIEDVVFYGGTFWTEFNLFSKPDNDKSIDAAYYGLNDFRLINNGEKRSFYGSSELDYTVYKKLLSPEDTIQFHNETYKYIKSLTALHAGKKRVVVTHHTPSKKSIHPKYNNDLLNACFSSDNDELLGAMDLWCHGHTHSNFDYMIDDTRVICNPKGYNRENHSGFIEDLVITI